MRWHILRTLLHKELLRHLANRGGLALVLMLVVASMLLSLFGSNEGAPGGLAPGMQRCYVDYWEESPLLDHLRGRVPADLAAKVLFRPAREVPVNARGALLYPQGTGVIQLRPGYKVLFWHFGADGAALAPYELWFWREAYAFAQEQGVPSDLPPIEAHHAEETGGLDPRSSVAAALVLFGLFFTCVYLLPSLTCEERERGVLLAQALSPASPREILGAKFLFYPALGLALAAVLAGTYRPAVLGQPFFWLALVVAVAGSMGIGLTIASLARTQRAAGMGTMCYTMAVALLLFICQQNGIPGLPYLALEYHCPRLLHAALTDAALEPYRTHLVAAAVLAVAWILLAGALFRRRGWQ
jgi:hypothetical protein